MGIAGKKVYCRFRKNHRNREDARRVDKIRKRTRAKRIPLNTSGESDAHIVVGVPRVVAVDVHTIRVSITRVHDVAV